MRNNSTGPSAQHLDGGGSERRSSLFDPFTYDLCQGQLGLEDWSCTDNVLNDYLDFLWGIAGEPPVSGNGIDREGGDRIKISPISSGM